MFGRGKQNNPKGPPVVSDEEAQFITTIAHPPVTHVEQYLSYYVSRFDPGYAVLVTGGWGTGKTHQVRAALPETHAHYVSLFGLSTPEDIEGQIFAVMYPTKAAVRKLAEKADDVNVLGFGTGGLASTLTSVLIKNAVDTTKPLILDDLERSSVDINTLLGLINRYVEHYKCRVIVIAHDGKIADGFIGSKEKIFGQTLRVEPNVDAAFSAFTAEFPQNGDTRYNKLKDNILYVFKESNADSLRILRHVVEDVGRLLKCLEGRHLNNESAMVEIVRLFSALAIEIRSGQLNRDDLLNRADRIQYYKYGGPPAVGEPIPAIVAVSSKYRSVNIGSSLLQDQVLVETLIEGRFVTEHIIGSLNSSAYFLEKEEAAPWQIVGSFDKLDDDIVNEALDRMEKQFAQREILESGEFLQVVSLKMMMAFRRLTAETVSDVRRSAIVYIDDLLMNGRLPERSAGHDWAESFDSSFGNVQYWIHDQYRLEFRQVLDYLVKARGEALERRLPDLTSALLDVVRTNGRKFLEKVCYTRNGQIEFEDIPILAKISPKDFVDAWLESPKAEWYWIANALNERRKALRANSTLMPEKAWYLKVQRELLARAKAKTSLARLRIIRAAEQIGLPIRTVCRWSGQKGHRAGKRDRYFVWTTSVKYRFL